MGIVDIGQQIPSILFRTIEEEFLDGIVVVVRDAVPNIFVTSFGGIPIGLLEKRSFPAAVPVVGHGKGRCGDPDKLPVKSLRNRFDKVVDVVEHQGQCQNGYPIALRHHREDRIIDQPVLHGIEDDELIDGADVNMFECIRRQFPFVTTHSSFFAKVCENRLHFNGYVDNLCCFSMHFMCFLWCESAESGLYL